MSTSVADTATSVQVDSLSQLLFSEATVFWPPVAVLFFLIVFAAVLWPWQSRSSIDRGESTTHHSERIYKCFEFYLKIALAITGAMGFIRLQSFDNHPAIARQTMIGLGWIALGAMMFFVVFIFCHQGSKLRRWKNIEWPKMIFWQELWMAIGMYLYALLLWVFAHRL